jgi:hypothetical protein
MLHHRTGGEFLMADEPFFSRGPFGYWRSFKTGLVISIVLGVSKLVIAYAQSGLVFKTFGLEYAVYIAMQVILNVFLIPLLFVVAAFFLNLVRGEVRFKT